MTEKKKFSDAAVSACEALLADKVTDVGTPGGSRRDSLRLRLGARARLSSPQTVMRARQNEAWGCRHPCVKTVVDLSFLASGYFTTSPRGTVANGTAPPSVT